MRFFAERNIARETNARKLPRSKQDSACSYLRTSASFDSIGLRGWPSPACHVLAHVGFSDVDAHFEQFPADAGRTPERILAAHRPNQLPNLFGHRRTPGLATTNLPRPE